MVTIGAESRQRVKSVTPEQFLQLARVLPEPTCLVSDEGRVLAANASARRLLGLPADEASPAVLLTDLAAGDPEGISAYLRACSLSAELLPGTLRLRAAGGAGPYSCPCEGAAVSPRDGDAAALLLLRLLPLRAAPGAAEQLFRLFMENLPGLAWI